MFANLRYFLLPVLNITGPVLIAFACLLLLPVFVSNLYNDGADYWFMDNSTFEQMPVSADMVGSAADWLKENDEATLLYAGDELISLEPQMFVELEVTHTEPGFKGDTATNTLKPATLETGKEVQVPTFIEIGDVLQIDTRDGRVIKRV